MLKRGGNKKPASDSVRSEPCKGESWTNQYGVRSSNQRPLKKELKPRLYEMEFDKDPSIEECVYIEDNKGEIVRVPKDAYVHETGEFIQLNCCLTPWCKNFRKSCITKSSKLAHGYSVSIKFDRTDCRHHPILTCIFCDYEADIISNRAAAALMNRFTRKYAPALFCENCSLENLNEEQTKNDYKWEYADPSPNDILSSHSGGKKVGENKVVKCPTCELRRTVLYTDSPNGFSRIVKNTNREQIQPLHDVFANGVAEFRRDRVVSADDEDEDGNVKYTNPRLGYGYYSTLSKYQFIAVEWIGYFNNLIRFGKVDIDALTDPKNIQSLAKRDLVESTSPKNRTKLKEMEEKFKRRLESIDEKYHRYLLMPQVQTDTLIVHTKTPASNERQQELRLTISVLVPSQYVLLATLNYNDQHSLDEIKSHNRVANMKAPDFELEGVDRELAVHAHKDQIGDVPKSSSGRKGNNLKRLHVLGYKKKGVGIRRPYHDFAHYYVLEKIVSKIPNLMLVQDGDRDALKACSWAFRERIAKGNCHVISSVLIDDKKSENEREKQDKGKKTEAMLDALKKDVEKLQMEYEQVTALNKRKTKEEGKKRLNMTLTNRDKPYFYSGLFRQSGVTKNKKTARKKKLWVSLNTLMADDMKDDSMKAAVMLWRASLNHVDSMCGQFRSREEGADKPAQSVGSGGSNYNSNFEMPISLQQLADVFTFSRNCIVDHSTTDNYLPAVIHLGLMESGKFLYQFIKSPRISSNEFIKEKYRFLSDRRQ